MVTAGAVPVPVVTVLNAVVVAGQHPRTVLRPPPGVLASSVAAGRLALPAACSLLAAVETETSETEFFMRSLGRPLLVVLVLEWLPGPRRGSPWVQPGRHNALHGCVDLARRSNAPSFKVRGDLALGPLWVGLFWRSRERAPRIS
eukprot:SAG25_NODE_5_length_29351_cov_43.404335_18_plen_145_part_00